MPTFQYMTTRRMNFRQTWFRPQFSSISSLCFRIKGSSFTVIPAIAGHQRLWSFSFVSSWDTNPGTTQRPCQTGFCHSIQRVFQTKEQFSKRLKITRCWLWLKRKGSGDWERKKIMKDNNSWKKRKPKGRDRKEKNSESYKNKRPKGWDKREKNNES